MLPTEAFAEAVEFLRLFDLDALQVANALCSSLALKASAAIRREVFPGLRLYVANQWIYIDRTPEQDGEERRWTPVELLTVPREDQMAEFVDAALPNCIFEELNLFDLTSKKVRDAIGRVADSIIIRGALRPPYYMSPDDSLELVRKFRKVKQLLLSGQISDDEAHEVAELCRESGVDELQYFPINGVTRKKLALF